MDWSFRHILRVLVGAVALTGCGLIDEDMADCDSEFDLRYEVRLVTNMASELQTRLGEPVDAPIASALRLHLQDVFSDYAHDADLSFYDVIRGTEAGDSLRLHHGRHDLNGSEARLSFYLPVREYMHLAVANVAENGPVTLEGDGLCHGSRLVQEVKDTVSSHRTGLFTGRLPMDFRPEGPHSYDVTLYMANCATALVLDTLGSHIRKLDAYPTGFATGFRVCDSSYVFQYTPYVRPDRLDVSGTGSACFVTVNFPSRDPRAGTRTVIETEAPFISDPAGEALWNYWIYATLPDGTVTRTRLMLYNPLRAGQLRILRVRLYANGSAVPGDPTVGVSVTTDWKPGLDHEIVF